MNRKITMKSDNNYPLILSKVFLFTIILAGILYRVLNIQSHATSVNEAFTFPNFRQWLGTDDLGMDIFSQILYGTYSSLLISVLVSSITTFIGVILGVISSLQIPYISTLFFETSGILESIPKLPILIVVGLSVSLNSFGIILMLSLLLWTGALKLTYFNVKQMLELPYIRKSKYYGASFWDILVSHIFKEILPIIWISFIRSLSRVIFLESSLSFLGIGDPTQKSLGRIIQKSMNHKGIYYTPFWSFWLLPPVIVYILIIVAVSTIGKDIERRLLKN